MKGRESEIKKNRDQNESDRGFVFLSKGALVELHPYKDINF